MLLLTYKKFPFLFLREYITICCFLFVFMDTLDVLFSGAFLILKTTTTTGRGRSYYSVVISPSKDSWITGQVEIILTMNCLSFIHASRENFKLEIQHSFPNCKILSTQTSGLKWDAPVDHDEYFESLVVLDSISGLVSSSHYNKNTIDWMTETKIYSHRLEVQDQGASKIGFWGGALFLPSGQWLSFFLFSFRTF